MKKIVKIYEKFDEDLNGFVIEKMTKDNNIRISYFVDGHFVDEAIIPFEDFSK